MRHVSALSRPLPPRASVKGDSVNKDCTPTKESFGKCEDDPEQM